MRRPGHEQSFFLNVDGASSKSTSGPRRGEEVVEPASLAPKPRCAVRSKATIAAVWVPFVRESPGAA